MLSGLAAGSTYYVRAYASNSDSTGYGAILAITTPLLDIITNAATNITSVTAITGGTITPNNGGLITASGVVVSTIANPDLTTADAIITTENATSGSFESNLSNLTAGTKYYVRAYATIAGIPIYGVQVSFTTETVLPVTLISFNAQAGKSGVTLKWITTSERNVKGFQVERSITNSGFAAVSGIVTPGVGTYSFLDNTVISGGYYYRLKTLDNNGVVKYSNIIYVSLQPVDLLVRAYPNPATNKINVLHQAATRGGMIKVLYVNGSVGIAKSLTPGNTLTTLDVSALSPGVYFIELNDAGKKSIIKFLKD